ncbi:MAG: sigma-E processing peptidase SpoIIGA [Firmicutes bacterium]|nr:sigma-E processing peptidase SpoIIGA [Bacillota bacterium]
MSIYLDLAFLINFLFDFELIILVHLICSKKIRPFRAFFAAFLGGMQGVLVFFPYFGILSLPPVSLLVSFMITAICENPRKKREFLNFYIIFHASSFFLAGIMTFMHANTILGALMILPVYEIVIKIKKEIFVKHSIITLCYKGKIIEKPALYDSGNAVFYLGKPVIFGNTRLIYDFFDTHFSQKDLEMCENVCIVPYKTVGKSGVVMGIRLDRAVVNEKIYEGAVLGFFDENFEDEIILNRIMV